MFRSYYEFRYMFITFDSQGKYIIVGGNEGSIHLWKLPYINSEIAQNTSNYQKEYLNFKQTQLIKYQHKKHI